MKKIFIIIMSLLIISGGVAKGATAAGGGGPGCPDVRFVYLRGSGATNENDRNYEIFREAVETKLSGTRLSYESVSVDYTSVGVGIDHLDTLLGAYIGRGDAYEFGASVMDGAEKLIRLVNGDACPNTRYLLGGYSQGALVVQKALSNIKEERIIYIATLGDPKIYLPEGKAVGAISLPGGSGKNMTHTGVIPAACREEQLSDYRMYVPDCYAYMGMMGGSVPWEPEIYAGRMGTWCNRKDILCSSYLSISDHVRYADEGLFEDVARVMAEKVSEWYGLAVDYPSPHDTAILIDKTSSMWSMIDLYREEAINLTERTISGGGRVALYTYGDRYEYQETLQLCDFESCTVEKVREELEKIITEGGGDDPESTLSAARQLMSELEWQYGATKSVVVLTDAGYHQVDFDGTTIEDVVYLSKTIDPVNFYVIIPTYQMKYYTELAERTDGRVVNSADDLAELTNCIMARHDALPHVEMTDDLAELPWLELESVECGLPSGGTEEGADTEESSIIRGGSAKIKLQKSESARVLVVLDDTILGVTDEDEFVLYGLELGHENNLTLTPITDERKGEPITIGLEKMLADSAECIEGKANTKTPPVIPKAPNTGRA